MILRKIAQDRWPWRRHNADMRRFLLLALPLVGACQTGSLVERGDHEFRLGNYAASLEAYEQAEAQTPDSEAIAARLVRTRHFLLESTVVDLLHHGQPEQALRLLDVLPTTAPADRQDALVAYRERAIRLRARQLNESGYQALENSEPEQAAVLLTEAIAWDPDLSTAQERLAQTEAVLETKARIGEEYYFEGMDHLREDQPLRARTSFMHASTLLGEDGLAQSRLDGLTEDLGIESLASAKLYLEAGLLGQAWVSAQDAVHLRPEDAETISLLDEITAMVKREALMTAAEVAVRGGRSEVTDEILQEILALGIDRKDPRLTDLSERNQDGKNSSRYGRARSYELDRQLVHAAELYGAILADEAGFGWEDVELRLRTINGRLQTAAEAYQRALLAEQAGDQEAYQAALNQTVQASVDYADALSRLRELHLAAAALEPGS